MPEKLNLKETLKSNPRVDARKLKDGLKMSKNLRSMGFVRRGYNLAGPDTQKDAYVVDDPSTDSRTVHLRHS